MDKQFRMRYVTFEERQIAGQARPKIVPVYHLGRSCYDTPEECMKANIAWLSAKIAENTAKGQQVTRFEVIAVSKQSVEEQPE